MNEPVLARLQHLMTLREHVEDLGSSLPWAPAADWLDHDTHLTLLLDVPGVDPASLALSEDGDSVTIQGQRSAPERSLSSERPSGSFSRTFHFPDAVLPQSGEAQLSGGVLTVRFEKRHPTIDAAAQDLDEPAEADPPQDTADVNGRT